MIHSIRNSISSVLMKSITLDRVIIAGLTISSLSLGLIAIRLGPVASYSKSFNRCIRTTTSFLSTVPGFRSAGKDGLEAMSVSLCNGSTPQQVDKSSSKSQ